MSVLPETRRDTIGEEERLASEHLRIIAAGDVAAVAANVAADYFNHRSADEPGKARQRGPAGFKATMSWLHRAFTDMRFEIHEAAVNGNRVALYVTLHARQHGPFVVYDSPDASVTTVFPSKGRSFAVKQTHWFTIANGVVAEHDAVRDDLGMAQQLGWLPPNPIYISRMIIALLKERRATKPLKRD